MQTLRIEDRFFAIFFATIFVSRAFLFLLPMHSPWIGDFHIHHYMYGVILFAVGIASRNLVLYAIGLGLIVDEIMIFPTHATTWDQYFSPLFVGGTLVFIAIVFLTRRTLVKPLRTRKN